MSSYGANIWLILAADRTEQLRKDYLELKTTLDLVENAEENMAKLREFRSEPDLSAIEKAYRFANNLHLGQKRDSGEPYMNHPLSVALILAGMRMDPVSIQAALLHDVIEDTAINTAELRTGEAFRQISKNRSIWTSGLY